MGPFVVWCIVSMRISPTFGGSISGETGEREKGLIPIQSKQRPVIKFFTRDLRKVISCSRSMVLLTSVNVIFLFYRARDGIQKGYQFLEGANWGVTCFQGRRCAFILTRGDFVVYISIQTDSIMLCSIGKTFRSWG